MDVVYKCECAARAGWKHWQILRVCVGVCVLGVYVVHKTRMRLCGTLCANHLAWLALRKISGRLTHRTRAVINNLNARTDSLCVCAIARNAREKPFAQAEWNGKIGVSYTRNSCVGLN